MSRKYRAHELWSAILEWWGAAIPDALERFALDGAAGAVEWRRESYGDEDVEEMREALDLEAVPDLQRPRTKRAVVGAVAEALDRFTCDLEDLEVRVNLDQNYHVVHPAWSRILIRRLGGRRLCVWASSAKERS